MHRALEEFEARHPGEPTLRFDRGLMLRAEPSEQPSASPVD
jgi:hypothetical protein